nr:hypothetical protein [Enterovibrio nigricans]
MLELITNNPEPNNEHFAEEHIRQYAPAFAADVIRFIIRQSDYDELRASSQSSSKIGGNLPFPAARQKTRTSQCTGTFSILSTLAVKMSFEVTAL